MLKIPKTGGGRPRTAGVGAPKRGVGVAPPSENAMRRARVAAKAYADEAAFLLNDPDEGFLSLSGAEAADGLKKFMAGEERLRRKNALRLKPGERELYARLTTAESERNLDVARRYAAVEAKTSHLALIDAEVKSIGVETWFSAVDHESRQEGLLRAIPRAKSLGAEKAGVLGLSGEEVESVAARCLKGVALSCLDTGARQDPVGAAGFFFTVSPFLSEEEMNSIGDNLRPLVTRALAEKLRDEVLSRGDSPEEAENFIGEANMPREVSLLALSMVRAKLTARGAAKRKDEEEALALAEKLMEENFGDPGAIPPVLWGFLSPRSREQLSTSVPAGDSPFPATLVRAITSKLFKLTGNPPDQGTVKRVLMARSLNDSGVLDDRAGSAVVRELLSDLKRRA